MVGMKGAGRMDHIVSDTRAALRLKIKEHEAKIQGKRRVT